MLRRRFLVAAFLATLVCATYSNSFQCGFALDSRGRILDDPRVSALSFRNLSLILTENYWWPRGYTNLYRPVTTLSYLLNHSVLFDPEDAAGYRLVNVLLHAANAHLVYLVAFLLIGEFWPAVSIASLWAVHPICTEAVTNIVGRADELAALAVLGALLIYVRSTTAGGRSRWLWRAALMACTLLGLLAKEIAAIIPAVALLFDVIYRKAWPALWRGRRELWAGYLVFAPPLLAVGCVRVLTFAHSGPMESPFVDNPLLGADFLTARLTAVKVIGKYLWLLVFPAVQSCDYSYNQIPLVDWRMGRVEDWKALAALAALVLLIGAAAALYRSQKAGFFFLGFLALALIPVSNLLFPIGTVMAERLLYLPSVGFAGCVVLGVYAGARRVGLGAKTASAVLALLLCAWGVRTYLRNLDWLDNETLWAAAVKASPNSFKTHMALAQAWFYATPPDHSLDEEMAESEKAVRIVAGLPPAWSANNAYAQLGEFYRLKGDSLARHGADGMLAGTPESALWYRRAVDVLSRGAVIDRAAATAMRRQQLARGKRPDQITPFGLDPLYASLGLTQLRLGRPREALEAFLHQRALDPGNPAVYRNISAAQAARGRWEEAVVALMGAHLVSDGDLNTAEIRNLYDRMDRSSCAVERKILSVLNLDCPLVRRDVCAALLDVTAALREANVAAWAQQTRDLAQHQYACPMEPFDRLAR